MGSEKCYAIEYRTGFLGKANMNGRIVEIADIATYLPAGRGFMPVKIKDGEEYKIPVDAIGEE